MTTMLSARSIRADAAPWWRGAVIYQIYPRSFADTNGDGVGDLPGVTAHLDYVASLGVDAVWVSPFFTSPMRDFGYDIADYRQVDPLFGTLTDFDEMVARAHEVGIKLLIDQVWSHTSDQHAWFKESRASWHNSRADWYVWADPKSDGSPPNNWQSVFGGPAWTWNAPRQQYYLHNFLPQQPDLNFHTPAVQDAILDVARFWLDRGVDGFRVDAINFAMHDPLLRDNPSAPNNGRPRTRPFDYQLPLRNQSHPNIPIFLERLRALTDTYADRFTLAEVGGLNAINEMHAFTQGDARLNSAYGFEFLYAPRLTPKLVADSLTCWPDKLGAGWPSWAFENHDAPRAVSRWAQPGYEAVYARMTTLLLLTLRGNAILYQGQELGLTQVEIGFEQLRDPEAITNWPLTLSRDGVRTPFPWQAEAPNCGFTSGCPWLPLGPDHAELAIDRQADPASLLNATRRWISLRRAHPALARGAVEIVTADEALLVFDRVEEGERVRCAFNLGDAVVEWNPGSGWRELIALNDAEEDSLPAFSARILMAT